MNYKKIDEAIDNGIKLSDYPIKDIENKLMDIIDTLQYMGLDFSQIKEEAVLTKIASVLKMRYGYLTDHELTLILDSGCQGEFKKIYQVVKGYIFFGWIKEYLEERRKMLQDKRNTQSEAPTNKLDVFKYPVGQAIKWKMDRVKISDWDIIPMKKVAEAIKNKDDMNKLADSYGIGLITRI